MPGTHSPDFIAALIDLVLGVVLTGGCTWLIAKARRRWYFPIFAGLLYSLTSLFGTITALSAIELIAPALDTVLTKIGTAAMLATSGAVAVFFLVRSCTREEMAILVLLLLLYFFTFIGDFSLQLAPLLHPPSFIAIYAVGDLCAAFTLAPYRLLHQRLIQHLRLHLSPHPIRPMTVGHIQRLSAFSAGAGILCLVPLAYLKELDQLSAAVPWGAGVCTVFFLLFTIGCWLHAAYEKRTTFVPVATWVMVIAHPADDTQDDALLFEGPTGAFGTIPSDMLAKIDVALQTGTATSVTSHFDNELQETQTLPSYCIGEWPHCLTCACQAGQLFGNCQPPEKGINES